MLLSSNGADPLTAQLLGPRNLDVSGERDCVFEEGERKKKNEDKEEKKKKKKEIFIGSLPSLSLRLRLLSRTNQPTVKNSPPHGTAPPHPPPLYTFTKQALLLTHPRLAWSLLEYRLARLPQALNKVKFVQYREIQPGILDPFLLFSVRQHDLCESSPSFPSHISLPFPSRSLHIDGSSATLSVSSCPKSTGARYVHFLSPSHTFPAHIVRPLLLLIICLISTQHHSWPLVP